MKANELWDTAIWLVNILLALGIMAFSFLYILFPSPRVEGAIDPASITGPESDGVEGPARKDIQHFRPTWEAKLTNPTPPPPVVNVVTPDKVYDFVGNLMGEVALTTKSTGAQTLFKAGETTPEGFTILEIRSASVVIGYKDGQGKPAQATLSKEAAPGALGAPTAAPPRGLAGAGGPGATGG
ncbi:MAG: hypothetical protein HZA54_01875, partial [Planctomycetes bacterium]|nr:hypothetical protein [Planctomycetota bacterium]